MLSCWGASFPSYRCCTSKCPACGVSTSFPIRSLRACCPPFTAIRAGCEAPLGCGDRRRNGDDPVPRLQRPYHLGDPVRALRRCGSRRQVHHAALHTLTIAHVDCDAFDATVEKRERPGLADGPVIIGGSRGVMLACCYVARPYGVRSAIPDVQIAG